MMYPWSGQRVITVAELAHALSASRRTVYGLIERQELRAIRVGNEYRVPRAEAFRILGERDPEVLGGITPPQDLPQVSPGAEALLARLRA